ncbi:catechol 2,3-dioxygenase-like lactoylglutathione lyase family enzyme [Microbacterium ginsengiterrae]|uniref:Catechol 2,3-dioxygenase-like lactoylglutathione lyase family enzyme n=1 Tax=Microbacterium ginsengiterrae TaxID=546115 RepID=A0A7W9CA71_9MICO|nr:MULTISPECIES: VOC family protein [Microbacterium]MBB5741894.1 catechol 2,3-dioxygenase-like lactoylglutathione lyase family enzyme [Microbacterium ginsengiterrae]
MTATGFYPVLMSDDVAAASSFYREALGFAVVFESDWYVSLRLGAFELAILDHRHMTVPEGYRTTPRGVIVNLEVDDVDVVHHHLTQEIGLDPLLSIRDEAFGQRHFIVAAPDGVLLDVIQPIPPSEAYAAAYAEA